MQQYQIVIIRPQGYVHSEAFSEIAETLVYALRKMSKTVTLDENNLNKNAVNIILGANLIKEEDVPNIPPNAIIYNFEQLTKSSSWMTSGFIKILKSFEV